MHVDSDANAFDQQAFEGGGGLALWLSLEGDGAVRGRPLVQPEQVAVTDQGV